MDLQTLSLLLIGISTVFIAWYTFETYKLRKNSIQPVLVIYLRRVQRHDADWILIVKNIGRGPACSTQIKPQRNRNEKIEFIINEDYIVPKEEKDISLKAIDTKNNELVFEGEDISSLSFFEEGFEIELIYSDIERKTYISHLRYKNGRMILENFEEYSNS